MAFQVASAADLESFIASANVTNPTYTADQYGNLTYTSGGIPQYCCVVQDLATGNPLDVTLSGANANIIGVAQDAPATGPNRPVNVQKSGIAKVSAASAINIGDLVATTGTGGQIATAPAAGATQTYIVGRALTAATEQGDIVSVQLMIGAATQVNA